MTNNTYIYIYIYLLYIHLSLYAVGAIADSPRALLVQSRLRAARRSPTLVMCVARAWHSSSLQ